ncbi:MAG: hypothetical protein K9M99_01225 [Candidatus Cloacimonetes bacterium]|nr:hypothetical protein [Candidatus Cloacimonadota bacterium]
MKLRYIVQMLIILILLLFNDGIYNLRQYSQKEILQRAEEVYLEIEDIPAVMIVTEENSEIIYDNLRNLYFVKQVIKQSKPEIIERLSSQYRLEEAHSLLSELNLPAILEIQFDGETFSATESSLFLQATEKEAGIFQIIYTEDEYHESWQKMEMLLRVSSLIEKYWRWIYWVFAGIILLIVIYFRSSYENRQSHYWRVYCRAGGNPLKKRIFRILNSVFLVFAPLILAVGTEYYLWIYRVAGYMPDFRFQIIRSAALLAVSLLTLLFIRREDHD